MVTNPPETKSAGKDMGNKDVSFWRLLKADWIRYDRTVRPGLVALVIYRAGHALTRWSGPRWVVLPITLLCSMLEMVNRILVGISISPRARLGPGLRITHFGGIFIGPEVVVGSNCNLYPGVDLGMSFAGGVQSFPRLGNRVFVAPGAKVFGAVNIGDDVMIGANSVVTMSLPPRAVAIGVPARVISYQGSFDYITYDGMNEDEERIASLKLRSFKAPEQGC